MLCLTSMYTKVLTKLDSTIMFSQDTGKGIQSISQYLFPLYMCKFLSFFSFYPFFSFEIAGGGVGVGAGFPFI